ncbi:hypothetical protein [Candidatus Phytoplasma pruni]|uniref:Uncharacterized protein n=1 Tax=Candidatus Phytoplasma pruni TaxID=479893 RepID=A0A851HGX4_9MOLU|nr:hypothetical protein [Candidatus Phytoplasma pruni]NWN45524.1 hypothetical protein [Candidatus Phytoplasma pruni]
MEPYFLYAISLTTIMLAIITFTITIITVISQQNNTLKQELTPLFQELGKEKTFQGITEKLDIKINTFQNNINFIIETQFTKLQQHLSQKEKETIQERNHQLQQISKTITTKIQPKSNK